MCFIYYILWHGEKKSDRNTNLVTIILRCPKKWLTGTTDTSACMCPHILAKVYTEVNEPNVQTEDNLNLSGSHVISLHDLTHVTIHCLFYEYFSLCPVTFPHYQLSSFCLTQNQVSLAYILSIKSDMKDFKAKDQTMKKSHNVKLLLNTLILRI